MAKLTNWFKERSLFLGLFVLLIFVPLYPKFPLVSVPGTYVAIRLEDFLVAILVGILVVKIFFEKINIFSDRLNRLILIYFLVGAVSSFSAVLITNYVAPHIVLLHWLRRLEYMSLFFVASFAIRKKEEIKECLSALFLATIGVGIYGMGQKFFGFPVISTMNEEFSKGILLSLSVWARVNATFAGHYDLAAYLVIMLAVIMGSFIGFRGIKKKLAILLVGVLSFYLLILTASQISFAAYLLAITAVLIFSRHYFWVIPVVALSVAVMFTSADFTQRYATTLKINLDFLSGVYRSRGQEKLALLPTPTPTLPPPSPVKLAPKPVKKVVRIKTTPTPTPGEKKYLYYGSTEPTDLGELTAYRSTKIRFNVEWPRSLRAFQKNPLLGTGYSSLTLATDNDYLRALGETGILGFVALGLIFLEIFRRTFTFIFQKPGSLEKAFVIGVMGAILGFLVNAFFIDVFEASKVAFIFWMLVGMMVATVRLMSVSNENK